MTVATPAPSLPAPTRPGEPVASAAWLWMGLGGVLALVGMLARANPWWGIRFRDWPWQEWVALRPPHLKFDAAVTWSIALSAVAVGFFRRRTGGALWVLWLLGVLLLAIRAPLGGPAGIHGSRIAFLWQPSLLLLSGAAACLAGGAASDARAVATALRAGAVGLLLAYVAWTVEGPDGRPLPGLLWLADATRGAWHDLVQHGEQAPERIAVQWEFLANRLLPAVLHAVALVAAWRASRAHPTRARRAARIALLAVAGTWVLPSVASWLRVGREQWEAHGPRAIPDSLQNLFLASNFTGWIVGTAAVSLLLAAGRPPPRAAAPEPLRGPRVAALLAAALGVAQILILLTLAPPHDPAAPGVEWPLVALCACLAAGTAAALGYVLAPRRPWIALAMAAGVLALATAHRGNDAIYDMDRFVPGLLAGVVWLDLRRSRSLGRRPRAALLAGEWLLVGLLQPLFIDPQGAAPGAPIPYIGAFPQLVVATVLEAPDIEQAVAFLVTPWAVCTIVLVAVGLVGLLGTVFSRSRAWPGVALALFVLAILYPIAYMLLVGRLGGAGGPPPRPGPTPALLATQETYACYVLALVALGSIGFAPATRDTGEGTGVNPAGRTGASPAGRG